MAEQIGEWIDEVMKSGYEQGLSVVLMRSVKAEVNAADSPGDLLTALGDAQHLLVAQVNVTTDSPLAFQHVFSAANGLAMARAMVGETVGEEDELKDEDEETLRELFQQLTGSIVESLKEQGVPDARIEEVRIQSPASESVLEELGGVWPPIRALGLSFEIDNLGTIPVATFVLQGDAEAQDTDQSAAVDGEAGTEGDPQEDAIETPAAKEESESKPTTDDQVREKVSSAGEPANRCRNLGLVLEVELPVAARLGTSRMRVRDVLSVGPGSLIELDRGAQDQADLMVDDRVVARGVVVVVEDKFGLRITEVESPADRVKSLA